MLPGTVRALRERAGWTQAQLAQLLGASLASVRRWERDAAPAGSAVLLISWLDLLPVDRLRALRLPPTVPAHVAWAEILIQLQHHQGAGQ